MKKIDLLDWTGRSGRIEMMRNIVLAELVALMLTPFVVIFSTFIWWNLGIMGRQSLNPFVVLCAMLVAFVVYALLASLIRRCHDLGWEGSTALLAFVPVAGIGFLFLLCGKVGVPVENKWGTAVVKQPTLTDKILAGLYIAQLSVVTLLLVFQIVTGQIVTTYQSMGNNFVDNRTLEEKVLAPFPFPTAPVNIVDGKE